MSNKPTITSGRYKLRYRGTECTNCSHPLDVNDRYCPNCSQANSTKKLTLKDFFDEFFASMISYDSRLLKTLSALLWRPGRITKDFIAGKRVTYTNPFRFLLSLSIVYFLLMNLSEDFGKWDDYMTEQNPLANLDTDFIKVEMTDEESKEFSQVLDSIPLLNSGEKGFIESIYWKKDSLILINPEKHYSGLSQRSLLDRFLKKRDFFETLIRRDSIKTFNQAVTKFGVTDTAEDKNAFNTAQSFLRVQQQPGSFFSAMLSRLPFLIFFFLPIFSLFIWLAYIRKKYNYTDHLIFSFHNQSLLFILLIISFLIDSIFGISTDFLVVLIFAVYLFIAMKRFYGQGWFKTIVKYIFLNHIFFILALLSVVLLFVGSAFTY